MSENDRHINIYQPQQAGGSAGMHSDEIDLSHLFKIFITKKWLIMTITAIAMIASIFLAYHFPDYYVSEAKVLIEKVQDDPIAMEEIVTATEEHGTTYFKTRLELIKSSKVLSTTVENLNLVPHYQSQQYDIRTVQEAVRLIQKDFISAKILTGTQVLEFGIRDLDPEMSAKITTEHINNFIRASARERMFLSDQMLQMLSAQGQEISAEQAIDKLDKMKRTGLAETLPTVTENPIVVKIKQEIITIESELKELLKRYTEKHPAVKEMRAKLEHQQSALRVQTDQLIENLKAGLEGSLNISTIKVLEDAYPLGSPSGPPRMLYIAGGTAVGFLLACFLAILLYSVDQKICTQEDVRDELGLPFLGQFALIKKIKRGGKKGVAPLNFNETSLLIDEIVSVKLAVQFSLPSDDENIMVFTSTIPGEGKTTVSSATALSFAESQRKTLLIDADMRRPQVHKFFGLKNDKGLSDCLAGETQIVDVIQRSEHYPYLHILSAGHSAPNPGLLLSSRMMDTLLDRVKDEYDYIIFDAPPALNIPDASIIATKASGIVMVFDYAKIHKRVAVDLLKKLRSLGCYVIGGVINRANLKDMNGYNQYYKSYNKYYSRRQA